MDRLRNVFYVYVIFRLNGLPCYVGKGHGDRWKRSAKHRRNSHLKHIEDSAGAPLPVVIVRRGLTDLEACSVEVSLIGAIGRESSGGPLINQTDGGDGASGSVWPEHQRARRARLTKEMWLGPAVRQKIIDSRIGLKHPPEVIEKMRKAWNNPDIRARRILGLIKADRGRKLSAEHLEKLKERRATDETKARMRVSSARRWAASKSERDAKRAAKEAIPKKTPGAKKGNVISNETRQKMSASLKGRPCRPATRLAVAEANRRRQIPVETRMKMAASQRRRTELA